MKGNVLNLLWGIKRSFLGYLERLPDCMIATNEGVRRDSETGDFIFPLEERQELASGGYRWKFGGDLRIQAHGGMLLVIFMNPWLTVTDTGTELCVIDPMHWPDTSQREVLGVSQETSGSEFPLVLAEEALETFNNVYPAGESLAPVRLA
ncbi:HtaA domain-containing protein [Enteractinococcus helveticum]|uniref:Htaa domain-containing protein n=1 Tax=Enteractinococcus helveticum TaxID=1837282 RepID=A0A1B7LUK6_9MICC|nr:HtaA domain-containing protein [Enteractinococcus helveticum]OAV51044.1 hypothetical protein A6F49_02760 [Enteractinococcus helveticum]